MFRERHLRLPHFTRSLRFRLWLMFLLIVLVTISIVAFFSGHSTAGLFKVYVSAKQRAGLNDAITGLNNFNIKSNDNPDPQIEEGMVDQIGRAYNIRLIVVNPVGLVIASNEPDLIGGFVLRERAKVVAGQESTSSSTLFCAELSSDTIVLSTNTIPFCPNLPGSFLGVPKALASPEQSFLNSVTSSIMFSVFLAGLIALILSLAFSYTIIKPIKRMTTVARRMEEGDLGQRLKVRTHTEIGELAHALNTMADGLQRSENLRRNLINDIAHELRTPLTNIRGYLEALQDEVVEPTPETIASLYEESALLTRLVTDLQELSLAEAGQLCLIRRPLALNECLLKAVHVLQLRAAEKEITLDIDLPPGLPWVEADPERVAQILRNLIGNAIMHTPEGGKITVSAAEHGNEVLVRVRDTGCGIEAQHLPYVFERFYRADSSRTRSTGGTGLGLAIVKQMVQAHGGQVSVESQSGRGSCFAFTLPALVEGMLLDYDIAG
ncbi:two-component sensor histidine kinase [Ktedonobacter sp. SOSP1-85]|uniref:sensor histidine kinase n=1 Tax=Ktedonobacter sp. SOSP1-85 TaxID=2778367 RepID=UPI0019151569|nr:ATP-binding protein [Ktedonobacter sp. SOSP1-85]GHO72522.1 two-component sensor histidine kinase [Ktedonobacter sp. SOSP1-85]